MNALAWLTWRQHRWSIICVTVLALLTLYTLLSTQGGPVGALLMAGFYAAIVQVAFGCLVGVFWGAPMIARELEDRTYFVAWGQDVTPAKWLRGKVLLLGGLAMALGALIGVGDGFVGPPNTWRVFEANPFVQAGYALFGLALGVFIGMLTRHVVTAMAATLVFYTIVRAFIAIAVRDHYLPAQRDIVRWQTTPNVPENALKLGGGFVGSDLRPVPVIARCSGLTYEDTCMRAAKAAVGTYTDYQPISLMWVFQLIEFLVFVLLAAVLLGLTFRMLRRGGGWKPSRRHRRIDPDPVDADAVDADAVDADAVDADAEPDAKAEVEPDAKAGAEPDAEAEAEPDAKAGAEPDAKAEAEPDAKADPEPDAKAEAEPDAKAGAEPDAEPEAVQSTPETAAAQAEG